ncbi:SPRY-domain-containing protein [Coniophora puteana RWD-64-598 SS2]|uniref:SPRY-domain-containing protein n=1 Tax=Coniophora puteana (strain RWD-64-598) TaxID=741705 RepID=A0A5M3N4M0_CONPW|nr:SPRY-domain-containing protein [Coniophora puteana RWD-64-598 SS2]EIW86343.1 SPRY-domain-containing protein [Coniophora puteana RWD-64-598 SS2]
MSTPSPTHAPIRRDPPSFSRSRISMDSDEDDMSPPPPRRDYSSMSAPTAQTTSSMLRLPTGWCEQIRHAALSVSPDGRELSYNAASNSGTDKDSAAARTTHPIPPACGIFYYEVEITSKTTKGHISIGFNGKDVKTSRLPGWEKHSWGYHGDDGLAFAADRQGRPYGPQFGAGDVIGCGIDFSQNKAFYTKNGKLIGHVFDNIGKDCELYPAVGLCHNGESIRANFGHETFKYDIDDHVLQQRNQTWANIQSTPLRWPSPAPDSKGYEGQDVSGSSLSSEDRVKVPINRLILAYLSHHGYARTARSFEATCKERGALSDSESLAPTSPAAAAGTEDQVMDMDVVSTSVRPVSETDDIELRTQIVQSVFRGDVDTALSETRKYFPAVLEANQGLMLIKLRCRKFVEMILEAAELKKKMGVEESEMAVETSGDGMAYEDVVGGMDIDDDASIGADGADGSTNGFGVASSSAIPIKKRKQSFASQHGGPAATLYGDALSKAVAYGQELQSDYNDRPEVRDILKRASVIVAYDDPLEAGGDAAEVAGQNARAVLATELNQAILQSQGRPTRPALERLYRQTGACLMQLALLGVGAAAFADMPKELLDA